MIIFQGDQWQNDSLYTNMQNMLLDFFRGDKTEKISLDGNPNPNPNLNPLILTLTPNANNP